MNKPYTILILGYPVNNPKEINHCFSMLTYGLVQSFKKLQHINLLESTIINPQANYKSITCAQYDLNSLPKVDFIIAINYTHFFTLETYKKLKQKCKKFVSFLEVAQQYCDYSFVFREPLQEFGRMDKLINVPYTPEFYENVPKIKKTILLDHIWVEEFLRESNREWSRKIWKWIEKLQKEYKISSLISIPKDNWEKTHLENLPSFITPIHATTYLEYLEKTKTFENFIITHRGSYNYSVFDMLLRGIRVISPPGFVCHSDIGKQFRIREFINEHELKDILEIPINKKYWDALYQFCTPMDKVVKIIDSQLVRWL